jgi:hypothetical protein
MAIGGLWILAAFAGYGIVSIVLFLLVLIAFVQVRRLLETRMLGRYSVSRPLESESIPSLAHTADAAVPTHRWRLPVRSSLVFHDENCKPVPRECTCYVFNDSIIAVFCREAAIRIDYDVRRDVRSVTILDVNEGKESRIAAPLGGLNRGRMAARVLSQPLKARWLKGIWDGIEQQLRYPAPVRALIVFRDFSSIEIECSGSRFNRFRGILPDAVFSDERIRLLDEQFRRIEQMAGSGVRASPELTMIIADVRAMRSRLENVMDELSVREASLRAVRYLLAHFPRTLTLAGDSNRVAASEGTAPT